MAQLNLRLLVELQLARSKACGPADEKKNVTKKMVGDAGIEPATPSMSTKCSPAELIAHVPHKAARFIVYRGGWQATLSRGCTLGGAPAVRRPRSKSPSSRPRRGLSRGTYGAKSSFPIVGYLRWVFSPRRCVSPLPGSGTGRGYYFETPTPRKASTS